MWEVNPGWDTIGDTVITSRAKKLYSKNLRIHTQKAAQLNQLVPLPKEGEQYVIVTEKQFNAFALICGLIENNTIDEMHLAIYRINQPTVQAIIDFIEAGKIKKGTFIISNFFNQTKKPEQWAVMLRDYCQGNKDFQHIYTHNHAKVLIARVKKDYYVLEGSGNMSDNARIEQYRYENNKQVFDFHKEWMTSISK